MITNTYISQLVIPFENQELIPMWMIGDGLMTALEANMPFNGTKAHPGKLICGTKLSNIPACSLKPLRTVYLADCLKITSAHNKICFRCIWDKSELHIAELLRHAKTSPDQGGSLDHWFSMPHAEKCAIPLFNPLRKIQPARPHKTDTPYLPGYYDQIEIKSSVRSSSNHPF